MPDKESEPKMNCTDYDRKKFPDLRVAYVRVVGPYGPAIGEAFGKLAAWAGPKGLFTAESLTIGAYWDDPKETPPEKCRADACLTIPDNVTPEPDSGIEVQTLPGGHYATFLNYLYEMSEFQDIWQQIATRGIQAIFDGGFQCEARPFLEIYYNCGMSNPLGKWVIDMAVPVN